MWILVLGMLVAVATAAAVILVVASPSFREGEPVFTPLGEERVDKLVDRASAAAARAESASRDGAQRAKSVLAKGRHTWSKGQGRVRLALANRRAEPSPGGSTVSAATDHATTENVATDNLATDNVARGSVAMGSEPAPASALRVAPAAGATSFAREPSSAVDPASAGDVATRSPHDPPRVAGPPDVTTSSKAEPATARALPVPGRGHGAVRRPVPGLLSRITGALEHAGADTSQPRARHSR